MKIAPRDEQLLRIAFLGIVLTLLYLAILVPLGFLQHARLRSADTYSRWRNALRAPPPQADDLLLVTIDEESQRRMQKKWPWDRGVFASFLTRVGQGDPKLVLFDLVLSGASDPAHDAALAQSIRGSPPVLLACYLDDLGNPTLPLSLFTEAGGILGLINKPRDADHSVRRLWAGVHLPGHEEPLYAIELKAACLALGIPLQEIRTKKDGLWIGPRRIPVERPGALAINPILSSRQIQTLPFWRILEGEFPPEQVRGKIVLLGTSSEITHDVYPTALGIMPGVMISANGILTVLAGDFLRPFPPAAALLGGGAVCLMVLFLTFQLPAVWGTLAAAAAAALAVGAGFLLHFFFGYRVESLSLILLASASWSAAMLYRYSLLAMEALRLHRQAITDPSTGAATARYLMVRTQAAVASHPRRRKPLGFCVVRTERPSELLQRASSEEVSRRLRELVGVASRIKPPGGLVGRLAEDCIGILLPGVSREESRRWSERLKQELRPVPGVLGVGVSCAEGEPSLTGEGLVRAASEEAGAKSPQPDSVRAGAVVGSGQLDFVASELEERNAALEKALEDLRKAHREMEQHFLEVTKSLVMALETKDEYTAGHLERVSRYSTRLAEALNLSKEEIEAIREAALLHDIGKIGIPDEVLHKVGPLTEEEKGFIRQHLAIGAKILEPMKFFRPITTLIYHHHERYDGKGYPHGLAGEFIPSGAQVITIADSFDAMTTARSYNKPKTAQEALEELRRGSGTQFNPQYLEAFVELILREGPLLAGHQALL